MTTIETVQLIYYIVIMFFAVIGAIFVIRQLREARKGRLLSSFLEMEQRLIDQREDRKKLYEWEGKRDDEWRRAFETVAVTFDVLGVLVREDIVYRPLLFKPYYDVIIKVWDQVRDHIMAERTLKAKTYMQDFEYLYDEANRYRDRMSLDYPRVHPPSPPHSAVQQSLAGQPETAHPQ